MQSIEDILDAYSEKPIAYMPIYSRVTGSVTAGVMLSQIVYWDRVMEHREFYKTDKEFSEELCMGYSEFRNAKKNLRSHNLISTKIKGIPAKTFYKLNREKLIHLILSNVKQLKQDIRKSQNY